jgi:hypothetical protein
MCVLVGCNEAPTNEASVDKTEMTAASFNSEHAPTVEFDVPDMMCPDGCGVAVKGILSKQPGAKDVLIDFENKKAIVAIEEGEFDSDKALAALVDKQFTNSTVADEFGAKPSAAPSSDSAGEDQRAETPLQ